MSLLTFPSPSPANSLPSDAKDMKVVAPAKRIQVTPLSPLGTGSQFNFEGKEVKRTAPIPSSNLEGNAAAIHDLYKQLTAPPEMPLKKDVNDVDFLRLQKRTVPQPRVIRLNDMGDIVNDSQPEKPAEFKIGFETVPVNLEKARQELKSLNERREKGNKSISAEIAAKTMYVEKLERDIAQYTRENPKTLEKVKKFINKFSEKTFAADDKLRLSFSGTSVNAESVELAMIVNDGLGQECGTRSEQLSLNRGEVKSFSEKIDAAYRKTAACQTDMCIEVKMIRDQTNIDKVFRKQCESLFVPKSVAAFVKKYIGFQAEDLRKCQEWLVEQHTLDNSNSYLDALFYHTCHIICNYKIDDTHRETLESFLQNRSAEKTDDEKQTMITKWFEKLRDISLDYHHPLFQDLVEVERFFENMTADTIAEIPQELLTTWYAIEEHEWQFKARMKEEMAVKNAADKIKDEAAAKIKEEREAKAAEAKIKETAEKFKEDGDKGVKAKRSVSTTDATEISQNSREISKSQKMSESSVNSSGHDVIAVGEKPYQRPSASPSHYKGAFHRFVAGFTAKISKGFSCCASSSISSDEDEHQSTVQAGLEVQIEKKRKYLMYELLRFMHAKRKGLKYVPIEYNGRSLRLLWQEEAVYQKTVREHYLNFTNQYVLVQYKKDKIDGSVEGILNIQPTDWRGIQDDEDQLILGVDDYALKAMGWKDHTRRKNPRLPPVQSQAMTKANPLQSSYIVDPVATNLSPQRMLPAKAGSVSSIIPIVANEVPNGAVLPTTRYALFPKNEPLVVGIPGEESKNHNPLPIDSVPPAESKEIKGVQALSIKPEGKVLTDFSAQDEHDSAAEIQGRYDELFGFESAITSKMKPTERHIELNNAGEVISDNQLGKPIEFTWHLNFKTEDSSFPVDLVQAQQQYEEVKSSNGTIKAQGEALEAVKNLRNKQSIRIDQNRAQLERIKKFVVLHSAKIFKAGDRLQLRIDGTSINPISKELISIVLNGQGQRVLVEEQQDINKAEVKAFLDELNVAHEKAIRSMTGISIGIKSVRDRLNVADAFKQLCHSSFYRDRSLIAEKINRFIEQKKKDLDNCRLWIEEQWAKEEREKAEPNFKVISPLFRFTCHILTNYRIEKKHYDDLHNLLKEVKDADTDAKKIALVTKWRTTLKAVKLNYQHPLFEDRERARRWFENISKEQIAKIPLDMLQTWYEIQAFGSRLKKYIANKGNKNTDSGLEQDNLKESSEAVNEKGAVFKAKVGEAKYVRSNGNYTSLQEQVANLNTCERAALAIGRILCCIDPLDVFKTTATQQNEIDRKEAIDENALYIEYRQRHLIRELLRFMYAEEEGKEYQSIPFRKRSLLNLWLDEALQPEVIRELFFDIMRPYLLENQSPDPVDGTIDKLLQIQKETLPESNAEAKNDRTDADKGKANAKKDRLFESLEQLRERVDDDVLEIMLIFENEKEAMRKEAMRKEASAKEAAAVKEKAKKQQVAGSTTTTTPKINSFLAAPARTSDSSVQPPTSRSPQSTLTKKVSSAPSVTASQGGVVETKYPVSKLTSNTVATTVPSSVPPARGPAVNLNTAPLSLISSSGLRPMLVIENPNTSMTTHVGR